MRTSKKVALYLCELLGNNSDDTHVVKEMHSINLRRCNVWSLRTNSLAHVISLVLLQTVYEFMSLCYENYFERNMKG